MVNKLIIMHSMNIIFHYITLSSFFACNLFPPVQNQQNLWYLHQLSKLYLFWKGRKYTFQKKFFTLYQLIIFHGKINKHLYLLKLWNHSDWKIKFCTVVFGLRKKLKNRRSSLMSEQNNPLMCYNFFCDTIRLCKLVK